jgi:heptosyltransferase-1
MNKILLIKTSALGDIVHSFSVVDYLRKKFPAAQIDWVVEAPFSDLVLSHPYVDNVLTLSTKSWRKQWNKLETWRSLGKFRKFLRKESYDVAFDLQGNIKSGLILSQVRSQRKIGFGKTSVPEWPNMLFTHERFNPSIGNNIRYDYLSLVTASFNEDVSSVNETILLKISKEEQIALDGLISQFKDHQRPIVAVCPGSAWRNKQMTLETLKQFLFLLSNDLKCSFLFVWGNPEERKLVEQLQFPDRSFIADKMALPMLQNLLSRCDLVIAMDSLPLHLAGTTTTPTFSIFGASSAVKYKPLGTQHHTFQGSCPYGREFAKRCPILRTCLTGACIHDLKAEKVFRTFKSWWIDNDH